MDAVVAVYSNWGIGRGGTQPLTLKADRRRFREATEGAAVIVGRRTLSDFPGGRPLKGRVNIVLTRQGTAIDGAVTVRGVEAAATAAGKYERAFVIGGESVYRQFFGYIDRVYVTKIDAPVECDSFFPNLDERPEWSVSSSGEWLEEDGIRYRFMTYERKREDFNGENRS